MRTLVLLAIACLCVVTCGCKRPEFIRLQPTIEEPAALLSMVQVKDPAASSQLMRGFYAPEGDASWRWTGPRFVVALGVPPAAIRNGAWLVLNFTLHEKSIETLKSMTLSAKAGSAQLAPETYTTAGEKEYRREVPASAFGKRGEVIDADFTLDKFLQPEGDGRKLGVIIHSVGLEAK